MNGPSSFTHRTATASLDAGQDASPLLGEGYDVFNDDFIFAFPAYATHPGDAPAIRQTQFSTITQSLAPRPGPG